MLISLLQKQIPFIDVRAPVEFSKGALPTSTNLPILFDEERELVGKAYKKLGGQSATELGHAIVKDKVKETKAKGKKVIAVGTTATRALETALLDNKQSFEGYTKLFIFPGFKFRAVDLLITNFHLPKSSLLMLVSAFIGFKNMKHIYETAVKEKYRFLSYGDAMLLKRNEI